MDKTAHRRLAADEPARKKRKRPLGLSILKWTGIVLLSLLVLGAGGLWAAYSSVEIPDPNAEFQTNTSFVYYADDKQQIGTFQIQNRQSIAFADMSQYVKDATVAAENRTFWTDPGFSLPSMARAMTTALTGGQVTGASTITQEYIKVLYLTQERTLSRKVKEVLLAAKMGQEMSKEQILEGYLNTVYFGRGAYGIEAASQAYFNKSQSKLSLGEAVVLVSIINNPTQYDPAKGDDNATELLGRCQYVLNGMAEMGTITPEQKNKAYNKLPKFPKIPTDSRMGGPKGFLLNMVQSELEKAGFSSEQVQGGGLHIVTTFDADAQKAAVSAVQKTTLEAANGNKKKAANLHGALVSLDNATGGVLALYGGPDFVKSSMNWATTPRPPASTFKPYAVAAALRDGWTLNDTLNGNPFKIDSATVKNDGNDRYGRITLLKATTHSVNTAFVDLVRQLPGGGDEVAQVALDLGVQKNATWDKELREAGVRVVLGGKVEASPLDQATGYSTFANEGMKMTPHVVAKVLDQRGNILYQAPVGGDQAIDPDVATDVTYALTTVAQDGTGRVVSALPYPVAGKTGTGGATDKNGKSLTISGWFVGFTKQITTAVMYVAGKGYSDLDAYAAGGFYGSGVPARTWLSYMTPTMDGMEKLNFAGATERISQRAPVRAPATKSPTPTPTPTPTPAAPTPPPTAAPVAPSPQATPDQAPPQEPAAQKPKPEPDAEPQKVPVPEIRPDKNVTR